MNIQWYPGHMAKMRRELSQQLKFIDVVAEVLDARAPQATHNPEFAELFRGKPRVVLLNKSDLASDGATKQWLRYYRQTGVEVTAVCARKTAQRKAVLQALEAAAKPKVEQMRAKGVKKTVRVLIAGIPNSGKSTVLNMLCGNNRAKTGNKPGVTRAPQWVKLSPYLELMDTPGLLWPKFEDQQTALHLAYLHAIRDEIMEIETLAAHLLSELNAIAPEALRTRYKVTADDTADGPALLAAIAQKRGFLLPGGVLDEPRAARAVLEDFRNTKLGRISLEMPVFENSGERSDEE